MVNNLRILTRDIITAVNNSETAKCMNDFKSQYDTGSTFSLSGDFYYADNNEKYAIVLYLAENPGPTTIYLKDDTYNSQIAYYSASIPYNPLFGGRNEAPLGYGSGGYIVLYVTGSQIKNRLRLKLEFSGPVKLSRIMMGQYWSPKYNANYGISIGYTDMTSVERLQGGDQYAVIGPRHKTLRFDLQYVDQADKDYLLDLAKLVGRSKPIFISVFPEDTDKTKEQMYSVIGRLVTPPNISHTMYSMYATSLEIEEL